MYFLLSSLLPFLLWGGEDFITDFEYGQMLYKNPRGISCATCHGINGEGRDIVSYKKDGEKVTIKGADIRNHTLDEIKDVVDRNHPVMPKYYLTREEVSALYFYIQTINNKDGKQEEIEKEKTKQEEQENQDNYEEIKDENISDI